MPVETPAILSDWNGAIDKYITSAPESDATPTPETASDSEPTDATPDAPETAEETPVATVDDAAEDAATEDASSDTPEDDAAAAVTLPFKVDGVDPAALAKASITVKIDGKERTLSVADAVRLAQSEPAAQRAKRDVEQRLAEREREIAAREAAFTDERTKIEDMALRMLDDDDFLLQMREKRQQYLTPEAEAQRAREEADALRRERSAEQAQRQFVEQATAFMQHDVMPAVNALLQKYPEVSDAEIVGLFNAHTAPYTRSGVIAPEHYSDVLAKLNGEIAEAVAAQHASRAARLKAAESEAAKARSKAQAAQNAEARAAKPAGRGSATPSAPKAPAPITTRDDAAAFLARKYGLAA